MTITVALDRAGWEGQGYLGSDTESTVPWLVFTTSKTETESAIMLSGLLPARGTVHPDNSYLFAFSCKLTRDTSQPLLWRAKIQYKTDGLSDEEKNKAAYPNPCNRPAIIERDTIGYTVVADKTVEKYNGVEPGSPIRNSALDLFDHPAEKTEYNWVYSVTKYVVDTPSWYDDFPGKVNRAAFIIDGQTVPAGCARLIGSHIGKRDSENGYPYRELKMTIERRRPRKIRYKGEFIPSPFVLELQDQGYYQRIGGELVRITDKNKRPCAVPMPLDGNGLELSPVTLQTTVYKCFAIYETDFFTKLPLS